VTGTIVIEEIVVVIPANDEETRIGECLAALGRARDRLGAVRDAPRVTTLVVLDACSDRTAEIVDDDPAVQSVAVGFRNVGSSRAYGVSRVLAGAGGTDPARIWIANTDADSIVPEDWLVEQLGLARSGVQLVIGAVVPDPRDLAPGKYRAWSERRRHDDGTYVHGANLGVRADAYLGAGGFPPHPEHEDVLLVDSLLADGVAWVRTRVTSVVTSARTVGRTPGGFAAFVRDNY
jgi:glycosyltransferase involved in cell wall biosynthesis